MLLVGLWLTGFCMAVAAVGVAGVALGLLKEAVMPTAAAASGLRIRIGYVALAVVASGLAVMAAIVAGVVFRAALF